MICAKIKKSKKINLNARWNFAIETFARASRRFSTYMRHIDWIFVAALYCR